MKRPLQIHSAISLATDMLAVTLAFILSYILRFKLEIIPLTKGTPPIKVYLILLPVALVLWAFVSAVNGLYAGQRKNSFFFEFAGVAKSGFLATLILISLTFFYRDYTFSRVMLALFWGISILLTGAARALIVYQLKARYRKGLGLRSVLIVGAGPLGQIVCQKIHELPQLGFKVVGFAADEEPEVKEELEQKANDDMPAVLGPISEVTEIIHRHNVEQVFIALPREDHEKLVTSLSRLDQEMIDIRIVPDILQFVFVKAGLESLDGIPIINLAETPLSGWYGPVKRVADIFLSTAALVLLSPLMLVIAALIKTTSRGPVFYRQERMSLDGSLFTMLKFRSMREDAENQTGAVWASKGDPRRTRIGALLRRTSLDELPQLINVLKGEMSFVGPRPERPVFVDQFRNKVPRYMMRHKVKCGLTGWAQVNGLRGNTSIEKRIEYDIFYIENWSLSFDLRIVWRTLWSGFINKHAY
jgi:Undecaprenyl-phosphate glucose phosphotransferase